MTKNSSVDGSSAGTTSPSAAAAVSNSNSGADNNTTEVPIFLQSEFYISLSRGQQWKLFSAVLPCV